MVSILLKEVETFILERGPEISNTTTPRKRGISQNKSQSFLRLRRDN